MTVSIIALFAGLFFTAFLIPEGIWQFVSIILLVIVFLIPCFYALKLEISVGSYKCKHCGQEFIPTYKEALMAQHRGFTRRLKCPNCKKRSWCKKIINNT
jgi:DNA-directed RNA polymerase subunit RPC12/RpoP